MRRQAPGTREKSGIGRTEISKGRVKNGLTGD